ncbi:resolvase-like protein [Rhodococcus sp. OK611]|nr:resolvase-like protein [Rhodococcus sp. OK611]SNX92768.1 Resolvase, N terminal domain [Rhodococcus sp. OK270]
MHTLDRLGRTVRDTLNLIHDLRERGVGIRNLADPIRIDSTNPDDPMAQLAVALLALFGQMERTYAIERAAQLAYAAQLRDAGATVAEITAKTGLTRSTLYRHLPPRAPETVTADAASPGERDSASKSSVAQTQSADLVCPTCGHRPATRAEAIPQRDDLAILWLHLDEQNRVHEQHHCVSCQPHGHVLTVSCSRCGDGPLVTGAASDELPKPVLTWLDGHGWTTNPELVCGRHNR